MKTLLQLSAAGLAMGLICSCQEKIPGRNFDPRDPNVTNSAAEGDFRPVSINQKVDPALLQPPWNEYRLGPGDQVEIEIADVPGTMSQTFVMPDGMVYYDLAGGVKAEGLTQRELSQSLQKALKKDYVSPIVNVTLQDVKSQRYWILGRVSRPNLYPLKQPTTLLEAISQAGGFTTSSYSGSTQELADLSNSAVIRDGKIIPVNFQKLIYNGDRSQNIYLKNNDMVYVPSAQTGRVLLLGAVKSPKAIGYKEGLTLVECMAYGQGPTQTAYLKKVVIVRGSRSNPTATVVDLQEILVGKAKNLTLRPGDIVWVPQSPFTFLGEIVETVIRDAVNTYAYGEGSRVAGASSSPVLTVPSSNP
jgi:polysaccharide biosynthesis/export protein